MSYKLFVFLFLCCNQVVLSVPSINLSRVVTPTAVMLEQERNDQFYTGIKRNVALGVKACTAVALVLATFKAYTYFNGLVADNKRRDEDILLLKVAQGKDIFDFVKARDIAIIDSAKDVIKSNKGWFDSIGSSFASFGKFVAEGMPGVVAPLVLNNLFDTAKDRVNSTAEPGSIQWFIQTHTQIGQLVRDLELYTMEYDIQSPLLSIDNINAGTNVHIKEFVHDMAILAQQRNQDNFLGQDYCTYLFTEVKKRYQKKGSELERLQDLALTVGQEELLSAKHELFQRDDEHRQDIASLCQMMAYEIQKVVAFAIVFFEKQQPQVLGCVGHEEKISDIMNCANTYFEQMELLLSTDSEQLQKLSIDGQGMFTITYEFSKLLHQQCEYLHHYGDQVG